MNRSAATESPSTFAGNEAVTGGGIYVSDNSLTLSNSILWGNSSDQLAFDSVAVVDVRHSVVQGGCPPGATCSNIIDSDPGFLDLLTGDLRLGGASPAVDAGDNDLIPIDQFDMDHDGDSAESMPIDLAGRPRLIDWSGNDAVATVDIGA